MRGHRDLTIVALLTLLCAVMAPLLPVDVLSLLFALPLALFLPGYALTAAIFARQRTVRAQVAVLSLGLSLCVLALGALLLNYAPGGIGPVAWAVLLALVGLNGCRVAALRRPPAKKTAGHRSWPRRRPSASSAGLLAAALLCAAVALVISFPTTSAKHADGYTALWLLPPTQANAAAGGAQVGVRSEERGRAAYLLRVQVGDRPDRIVRRFSLGPAETRVLKLTPDSPQPSATPVPVSAALFLQSKPGDAYRRVSGWLAAPKTGQ